jgi:inhibitor of cysteine peptidase
MIQVDDSFDGRLVELKVGEMIEITLNENVSTGYRWILPLKLRSKWRPTLRQVKETPQARSTQPGTPGVRCLYFEALREGKGEVQLEYRRSWEALAKAARTFRLRFEVQPR